MVDWLTDASVVEQLVTRQDLSLSFLSSGVKGPIIKQFLNVTEICCPRH